MFHLHARVRSFPAVIGALVLVACSDPVGQVMAPAGPQARSAAQQSEEIHAAIAAQERNTPAFMRVPGVLGTAVGLNPAGRAVVQVFVLDNTPRNLPGAVDDIPVQVIVTGLLVARSDPTIRMRPAPIGYSVGHPLITAGTIGARVISSTGV